MERLYVRCLVGRQLALMHTGLTGCVKCILKGAGVRTLAIRKEPKWLRGGSDYRQGGIVVLMFYRLHEHLLLEGGITSVYPNTRTRDIAFIPGTKQAEEHASQISTPVSSMRVIV